MILSVSGIARYSFSLGGLMKYFLLLAIAVLAVGCDKKIKEANSQSPREPVVSHV
jgi:hypothetical protein